MSTYRVQLPEEYVAFLTDPGGVLGLVADHVRDGDEFGAPGWTYFDETCVRLLRELSLDDDGFFDGEDVWIGGLGHPLEWVSDD